jgi:polysaccharide deacetylase 2 family uncharacterized protein YibQ
MAWHSDCSIFHQQKTLVLIIDDIGHQLTNGRAAVDLPGKLNIAILPYTPHGKSLAERAHRLGKEVLLHAPMSSLGDQPLGRGGLTPELSEAEFRNMLREDLGQVPHARGINNHMGSDLTRRHQQMGWLMGELQQQQLYFVDSRTSHETVAAATAGEYGVPHLSRQVFLDNDRDAEAIENRFREALELVNTTGSAVAIGHPYPETIRYLQEALPQLASQGIRLAYASELSAAKNRSYSRTSMPRAAM